MVGGRLLRAAAAASATLLLVVGIFVIGLQGRREDIEAAERLRTVGYGVGAAFLAGSVLCLAAFVVGHRRAAVAPLVTGAVLLTAAVSVPSLFSAAYPLVLIVWAYAWALRRDLRAHAERT